MNLWRPGSVPTRVRFTPDSQDCMLEKKGLSICDGGLYKQLLNKYIFTQLSTSSPKKYLLHHTTKFGPILMDLDILSTTMQPGMVEYQQMTECLFFVPAGQKKQCNGVGRGSWSWSWEQHWGQVACSCRGLSWEEEEKKRLIGNLKVGLRLLFFPKRN